MAFMNLAIMKAAHDQGIEKYKKDAMGCHHAQVSTASNSLSHTTAAVLQISSVYHAILNICQFHKYHRVQQPSYSMLVVNLAGLALLAIFGQTTLAAPVADVAAAPDPSKDFMAGVDTSTWVSVQFQGKTITYNPALVHTAVTSTSGTSAKRSVLNKRGPCSGGSNEDCCTGSTFNGTPAPWAWTSDCIAIRDWAYAQHSWFNVVRLTGDYHGIVYAGSCAFGAGTNNFFPTYIGSTDIGDLTKDGINIFAVSVPAPKLQGT
jgi:hypothetical protein